MKKSMLVTKFLQSRDPLITRQEAHNELLLRFSYEFPIFNFLEWDIDIDDEWCECFFQLHNDDQDVDLSWLVIGLHQVK